MPATNHDRAEDQLAEDVPAATEAIRHIGQTDTDAHASVRGDDLEDDVEDGIIDRVALELAGFGDGDEEDCEHDPPRVVRQLAAELLPDEVTAGFFGRGLPGEAPAQASHELATRGFVAGVVVVVAGPALVGVDAQTAFFVDVGVSHRDHYGVHADVHHQDVEHQEANAEVGNWHDIKASAADGESLEKAVENARTTRKSLD